MLREVEENINVISNKITNIESQTNELWDITNYISENLKNVKYTHIITGNIDNNPTHFRSISLTDHLLSYPSRSEYYGEILIPMSDFKFEDIVQIIVRTRNIKNFYYWSTNIVYRFNYTRTDAQTENWVTVGLTVNDFPTFNNKPPIGTNGYITQDTRYSNSAESRGPLTHMMISVYNETNAIKITDNRRQSIIGWPYSGAPVTNFIITREFCDYIILLNKDLVLTEKKLQDRLLPPLFLFYNKGGNICLEIMIIY